MTSKPEQITQALMSSLQSIHTSSGYRTNIGAQIQLAEQWFDGEQQISSFVSVFLEEEECQGFQGDVLKAQLSFNIEVHGKKSDKSFNILAVFDDLKRCCLLPSRLSELAHQVHYHGFHIHVPDEGRAIINGKLTISIDYVDNSSLAASNIL